MAYYDNKYGPEEWVRLRNLVLNTDTNSIRIRIEIPELGPRSHYWKLCINLKDFTARV